MSTIDQEMVLAHFIVSDDVERSRHFYTEVLGGRTVISGEQNDEVTYVALANSWIIINVGGGPTDDKPTVIPETPRDPDRVSSFLNIRVRDIAAVYAEWSRRNSTSTRSAVTSAIPTVTSSKWVRPRTLRGTGTPITGHRVRPQTEIRDNRDHRDWWDRIGHCPSARRRWRDSAPLERRQRVGAHAGCKDRSGCGRQRR